MEKKLLERFMKKNCRRQIKWKVHNNSFYSLIVLIGLIKKMPFHKMSYYPKPESYGRKKKMN